MQAPPMFGVRPGVLDEGRTMISFFTLVFFALLIVYTSRIPPVWFQRFRHPLWQFVAIVLTFGVFDVFGWIHGVLLALAFALILSHSYTGKFGEPFVNYYVKTDPERGKKRWLSEKILGENPYMIREINVSTSAVQDDSSQSSK